MIQVSGGVLVPGIDSVMSHVNSSAGFWRRMASTASANCWRTSAGLVRGLTRTSTSSTHSAGDRDAVRAQPPSMWPMFACGATRPDVLRTAYFGNQASNAWITAAASTIGFLNAIRWRLPT